MQKALCFLWHKMMQTILKSEYFTIHNEKILQYNSNKYINNNIHDALPLSFVKGHVNNAKRISFSCILPMSRECSDCRNMPSVCLEDYPENTEMQDIRSLDLFKKTRLACVLR